MPEPGTALVAGGAAGSLVEYSAEELEVIKKHLAPNCGDVELRYLIATSRANGMNVIKKDCYFVPRRQWDEATQGYILKWVVVTSIDYYRKRGVGTGLIEWFESKVYFIAKTGTQLQEYEWRNLRDLGFPPYPMYARARIKRKDMSQPIEHTVYWNEYAQYKKGSNELTAMWKSMPGNQLAKCAEAGCWRKAVPELSGVYINDEMKDDNPQPLPPPEQKRELPPPEKKPESPPAATTPQDKGAAVVSAFLLELSQCNTAEEIQKFEEVRGKEIASLATPENEAITNAIAARKVEVTTPGGALPPAPEAPPPPPPPSPEPQSPADRISEDARRQAAADAPVKKHATDTLKRVILKICFTLEDDKGKSFIANNAACEAFVCWLFKVQKMKDISLDDASRFIGKFNNFKDQKGLFDLYCKFRNETDPPPPQG